MIAQWHCSTKLAVQVLIIMIMIIIIILKIDILFWECFSVFVSTACCFVFYFAMTVTECSSVECNNNVRHLN